MLLDSLLRDAAIIDIPFFNSRYVCHSGMTTIKGVADAQNNYQPAACILWLFLQYGSQCSRYYAAPGLRRKH
jgi:hypothetical protein